MNLIEFLGSSKGLYSFFCPACGTKTNDNTKRSDHSGDYNLTCDCGFIMRFYIYKERDKTDEQVEASFQQTELTDSQKFGGGKRKFKK